MQKKTIRPVRLFTYFVMTALVAFMSLPLIYMVSTAFKPMEEIFLYPPRFFARRPVLNNFYNLLGSVSTFSIPFSRYILNSLFTTVVTVIMTVIISCMGAYGLVKHKPRGSGFIMAIIIAALMFSSQVTAIPSYIVVNKLNLINRYGALILPKLAVAFNFFLMKQFMEGVPDSLLEAARIDGAGEWKIFWRLVMPCVRPAYATLVVFSFITAWNDYFSALIYTNKSTMKTLPLALQLISGGAGASSLSTAGVAAAASLVMVLPTVILFVIMQSRVVETMAYSGIKS